MPDLPTLQELTHLVVAAPTDSIKDVPLDALKLAVMESAKSAYTQAINFIYRRRRNYFIEQLRALESSPEEAKKLIDATLKTDWART